jgi:hypothetical protein
MPNAYIKKLAKEGKGTVPELELKWEEAKRAAATEGKSENYGYINSIFKTMVGASSSKIEASSRLRATRHFVYTPTGVYAIRDFDNKMLAEARKLAAKHPNILEALSNV